MPDRLEALARTSATMARAAAVLRALERSTAAIPVRLPSDVPDDEAARVRLAAAIPALAGERLLDGEALVEAVRHLCSALEAEPEAGAIAAAAQALARALERELGRAGGAGGAGPGESGAPGELAEAALANVWDAAETFASRTNLDPDATIALLDHAARPMLRAGAAALRTTIAGAHWTSGLCPGCGAAPTLSLLRDSEGERVLQCGRCGTAWRYPRVRCTACGESDHRQLRLLHGEGEESWRRVEVCERCRGYVKSVAVLDALDPAALLEEDLASAGLDLIAIERGYRRGGSTA